ncbi:MAG: shikimate dehydrogenase [Leptospirales bacterium]|nr:shikimate dehydrogenase [Leptospirales bacterium]
MARIDGSARLFGILGHPVAHSLSPLLHNTAFESKSINALYAAFNVAEADASLKRALLKLNVSGLSITIPHKSWAFRFCDAADDLSQACEAANTWILREDEYHAYNTDGPGAIRALQTAIPELRGKRHLLLGYGGAAAAIAFALAQVSSPGAILISGRNRRKGRAFAQRVQAGTKRTVVEYVEAPELRAEDFDVVINTTPLGMEGKDQGMPLPSALLAPAHTVFDIVYTPMRTPLIAQAAERRCTVVYGYYMLLYQAALQFELFTGEAAPENLMERELLSALRRKL